ncbi:MAG: cyclic nucleotide-binding domain-containing protein [Bacteroidota bacterium]
MSFLSNLFKSQFDKTEIEEMASAIPLFRNLGRKDISSLFPIIHTRIYSPDEYIFRQNDPGIAIYIIQEGEVCIKKEYNDGKSVELTRFFKGDIFGELALVDDDKRSASAVSAAESKIAVIFKPDLEDFISKNPRKGILILRSLSVIIASRLRKIDEDYTNLYTKTSIK